MSSGGGLLAAMTECFYRARAFRIRSARRSLVVEPEEKFTWGSAVPRRRGDFVYSLRENWLESAESLLSTSNCVFERPTRAIVFRSKVVPAVYGIASAILGAQAYVLRNKPTTCKILLLVVLAYLMIGCVLPCWSQRVARSDRVQRLLEHRDRYKNIVGSPGRFYARLENIITPVSTCLALVDPGLVLLNFVMPEAHVDDVFDSASLAALVVFGCTFISLFGMLTFGAGLLDILVLDASKIAIEGLILEIKDKGHPKSEDSEEIKLDCKKVVLHHRKLHRILADVWGLKCVGGIWFARVCMFFISSLVLAACSINAEAFFHSLYMGACVMLALGGVALLLCVAQLTQLCTSRTPESHAVMAAVGAHAIYRDDNAYQTLLMYVNANPVGITACYIHITHEMVFKIFCQTVVVIPFLVGVISHVLHAAVA